MKMIDSGLAAYGGAGTDASATRTSEQLTRLATSKDPKSADKAAREFEAYFVQYMLQQMRKTVPHSDLLGDRHAMEIFESMLDESIGRSISEGQGMGLADQLRGPLGGDPDEVHLPVHLAVSAAAPAAAGYPHSQALKHLRRALEDGGVDFSRVTSGFGERIHPLSGEPDFHAGVDIALPEGSPVRPAAPGTVTFSGEQSGYGNLVIVQHANGYSTRYAHNSKLLVTAGQEVTPETLLAESGSTGNSTGPHLHFEVRKDGVAVDPRQVRWARLP